MGDKTGQTNRDKIVLEYLSGGVTYRKLEAKWGVDHATIQRWVLLHQGVPRNRKDGHPTKKSTIRLIVEKPPAPPPVDIEKVHLQHQLRQAELKIKLLEEVLRLAQTEQGLTLPKKFITAPAARQAVKTVGQQQKVSVNSLCPLLGLSRPHRRPGGFLSILPQPNSNRFSRRDYPTGSLEITGHNLAIRNPQTASQNEGLL